MLFLRDDIEQAKRVCDLGIKECGRDLKATDVFTKKVDFILYVPSYFSYISWILILQSLNITRLDVEIYLYGSKNGMEAIQSLFALHKRLFGSSTSTLAPPNQSGMYFLLWLLYTLKV